MHPNDISSPSDFPKYWIQSLVENDSLIPDGHHIQKLKEIAHNLGLLDWERYLQCFGVASYTTEEIISNLSSFITWANNQPQGASDFLYATALFNIAELSGKNYTVKIQNYEKISTLFKTTTDSSTALVVANSLYKVGSDLCRHNTEFVKQPLEDLRQVADRHCEPYIIENLSRLLRTAIWYFGEARDRQTELKLLEDLRTLAVDHNIPQVQEELANVLEGICWHQKERGEQQDLDNTLTELRNLAEKCKETTILVKLAKVLSFSNWYFGEIGEIQKEISLLDELRIIEKKHSDLAITDCFAIALKNTIWHFGIRSDFEMTRFYLEELRILSARHSNNTTVKEHLADSLSSTGWHFGNTGDIQAEITLLDELRHLTASCNTPQTRKHLADGLSSTCWHLRNSKSMSNAISLLDELRELANKYNEKPIKKHYARALKNACWFIGEDGKSQIKNQYLDELEALVKEYDDQEFREFYASALANVGWHYGKNGDVQTERLYLKKIRTLANAHNELPIWEQLTGGLVYAIQHTTNNSALDFADEYLTTIRDIANRLDTEPFWQDLAKALTHLAYFACVNADAVAMEQHLGDLRSLAQAHSSSAIQTELCRTLFNYATMMKSIGNLKEAYDACEEAEKILGNSSTDDSNSLKESVSVYKNRIGIELNIPEDKRKTKQDITEQEQETDASARTRMIQALDEVIASFREVKNNFLSQMKIREQRVTHFLGPTGRFKNDASILMVLRQWNSYTPIIVDGLESDRGGGYFIRHKRIGLVIDPGYNFIELFHKAGCKIVDITHIAITHAHDDHTAQLEQLLTMLYQFNTRNKKTIKKVTLLLNHSTLKKFSGFNLHRNCAYIDKIVCLNAFDPNNVQTIALSREGDFSLTVLKAYHDDVFTTDYAIGLGLHIGNGSEQKRIVFTGDTGFYPPRMHQGKHVEGLYTNSNGEKITERLVDEKEGQGITCSYPKEFKPKRNEKHDQTLTTVDSNPTAIDLLIPHLGSIKEYEFDPVESTPVSAKLTPVSVDSSKDPARLAQSAEQSLPIPTDPENMLPVSGGLGPMFYPNHLGILGTAMVIKELLPKAVILSEFGSELRGLRMEIAKLLRESLEKTMGNDLLPFIIPGDPTIIYNIPDGRFLCHEDGEYHLPEDLEAKEVGGDRIGLFKRQSTYAALERYDKSLQDLMSNENESRTQFILPYMNKQNI